MNDLGASAMLLEGLINRQASISQSDVSGLTNFNDGHSAIAKRNVAISGDESNPNSTGNSGRGSFDYGNMNSMIGLPSDKLIQKRKTLNFGRISKGESNNLGLSEYNSRNFAETNHSNSFMLTMEAADSRYNFYQRDNKFTKTMGASEIVDLKAKDSGFNLEEELIQNRFNKRTHSMTPAHQRNPKFRFPKDNKRKSAFGGSIILDMKNDISGDDSFNISMKNMGISFYFLENI